MNEAATQIVRGEPVRGHFPGDEDDDHVRPRVLVPAEPDSGDGAGILMQVPHKFFRAVCDFELPSYSSYAVGTAFIPGNAEGRSRPAPPFG